MVVVVVVVVTAAAVDIPDITGRFTVAVVAPSELNGWFKFRVGLVRGGENFCALKFNWS